MRNDKSDIEFDLDLNVAEVPLLSDLERRIYQQLSEDAGYLATNPSMVDLEHRAPKIIEHIETAAGLHLPSLSKVAIQLALRIYLKFEQLGFSKEWYVPLLMLYNPAQDLQDGQAQSNLYRAMLYHYLYRGDLARANTIVQALVDIAGLDHTGSLQTLMMGAATIAAMGGTDRDAAAMHRLTSDLLSLAHETRDTALIGGVYSVLSQYYAHEYDVGHTFEYGQMTYCAGMVTGDDAHIINGLHFMALAFQIARSPGQAIPYLTQATAHAIETNHKARVGYLLHAWATCHYLAGDYIKAESVLREYISQVDDQGIYYAAGLHTHGLILTKLEKFRAAEQMLLKALKAYERLQQPFNVLSVRHALADVRFYERRYEEAIAQLQAVATDAEGLNDTRKEMFLKLLGEDLKKYALARDTPEPPG